MTAVFATKLLRRLARLSHYSPKGKFRLALFFLRLASNERATPSFYGPLLQTRWHDETFKFCIQGWYGSYLSNLLRSIPYPYSFIDIGANIGLYSLVAADSPNCRNCYAFEPNPIVFDSLQQNIAINNARKIQAFNFAVSDTEGWLNFETTDAHSGVGKLVNGCTERSIKVKSVNKGTFEKIAAADRLPKVVKIDVEGHELVVIKELLKSSIWQDICHLYTEANEARFDVPHLVEMIQARGLKMILRIDQGDDFNMMFERPRE